jgi:hypothetical protein
MRTFLVTGYSMYGSLKVGVFFIVRESLHLAQRNALQLLGLGRVLLGQLLLLAKLFLG